MKQKETKLFFYTKLEELKIKKAIESSIKFMSGYGKGLTPGRRFKETKYY